MNIGLYFGSFNPIHVGHLLVATHIREAAQLDEIWFVVSPQNPFKINTEMANENHRLEMVKIAIKNVSFFSAVNIEFNLPKPSYTYITLQELTNHFPENKFHLIIGEDNVAKFQEWKEAAWIQANFKTLIYNREKSNSQFSILNSQFYSLPMFNISSTEIRLRIKNKQSIKYFVVENVEQFIEFHKLYY